MTEEICNFLYYYLSVKPEFTISGVSLLNETPEAVDRVLGIPIIAPNELADRTGRILISCYTREYDHYLTYAREHFDAAKIDVLSFDLVDADVDKALQAVGGRPLVLFGAGGCGSMLLENTDLANANVVAFSDNDQKKWGGRFCGKAIIPPEDIRSVCWDVLILSRAYEYDIKESLQQKYGDTLKIHLLYH